MFRITNREENKRNGPILLVHGFLGYPDDWIKESTSPAYEYANLNYDVWLLTRGTVLNANDIDYMKENLKKEKHFEFDAEK